MKNGEKNSGIQGLSQEEVERFRQDIETIVLYDNIHATDRRYESSDVLEVHLQS